MGMVVVQPYILVSKLKKIKTKFLGCTGYLNSIKKTPIKQDLLLKVSSGAKIRNRYNQVPHLTQDTNGKVTNSQKTPQTRAKRSALSQQVLVLSYN